MKFQDTINKYTDLQRQYPIEDESVNKLIIYSQHFNFTVSPFAKFNEKYKDSPFKFYLKETISLSAINHIETDYSDLAFIYINESYREAILNLFKENT